MSNQEIDNSLTPFFLKMDKKPRGRPRVKPIKDDTEPKRPRGRQIGFKLNKEEPDPIILKQKKAETNKKSFAKRGKMIQTIKKYIIKYDLEPIDYKNMSDDTLKIHYDEILKKYETIKEEKKLNKIEQTIKQLKHIKPTITFI
jgi:hypothetical protein